MTTKKSKRLAEKLKYRGALYRIHDLLQDGARIEEAMDLIEEVLDVEALR